MIRTRYNSFMQACASVNRSPGHLTHHVDRASRQSNTSSSSSTTTRARWLPSNQLQITIYILLVFADNLSNTNATSLYWMSLPRRTKQCYHLMSYRKTGISSSWIAYTRATDWVSIIGYLLLTIHDVFTMVHSITATNWTRFYGRVIDHLSLWLNHCNEVNAEWMRILAQHLITDHLWLWFSH